MGNRNRNKRKKTTPKKKKWGLGALSIPASSSPSKISHQELLGVAGSFVAGAIISHAIGNNLIGTGFGLAAGGTGLYNKNIYLAALGTGMIFSTPAVAASQNMNGLPEDEVNGLNFKNFTSGAKTRVGSFFTSFKDKFKLPKQVGASQTSTTSTSEEGTNGMGDVYTNPYQIAGPDMSELDKIEKQIDAMNGLFGDELPNREF